MKSDFFWLECFVRLHEQPFIQFTIQPNPLMKNHLLSILILLFAIPLPAQIIFDYHFPDSLSSTPKSLRVTEEGYLIGGSQLLHVDVNGNVLTRILKAHNRAHPVAIDSGSVFIWSDNIRGHVERYDKKGNQLWETIVRSAVWRNKVEDVITMPDGSFITTGRHATVAGSGAAISKLDSAGKVLWERKWNAGSTVASYGKEVFHRDSMLYVIGRANAGNGSTSLSRDIFVSRHSVHDGIRDFAYLYKKDSTDDVIDLLFIKNNQLLLLCNTNGDTSLNGNRGMLISLSDTSNSAFTNNWIKKYPTLEAQQFRAIEMAPDSGYLIMGNKGITGQDSTQTFLLKVDPQGVVEWEYVFENAAYHHTGMEMIHEGGAVYVMAGYTEGLAGDRDYFLTKFDLTHLRDSSMVGIAEHEFENQVSFSVFPNPVEDHLKIDIQAKGQKIRQVQILDLSGKVIEQFGTITNQISYECGALAPGVYIVEVQLDKGRMVKRFVVK